MANIHVGWRGNVARLIGKSVKAMTQIFASRTDELLAAISPSLGPCCGQFVNHTQEFPADFRPFQVKKNYFDLWQLSAHQLEEAGLAASNISTAKICTCCHDDYFSYRRKKITGRCATIIGLCHDC